MMCLRLGIVLNTCDLPDISFDNSLLHVAVECAPDKGGSFDFHSLTKRYQLLLLFYQLSKHPFQFCLVPVFS